MNPIFIDIKEFPQRMQEYKDLKGMDFLRELIGMDWGEEGLGVIYILENSDTHENLEIAIKTTDREHPTLPTVCHLWSVAELYEREVYDFFGIHFTDHPDMRRLFLRNDWVGYPLRKDYDESEAINPVRMESEITEDVQREYEIKEEAELKKINAQTNRISGDQYVINIGPQHPATHGVLRFRLALEGEEIRKIDIHCGYIHRGIEKMSEKLTYPQILGLTDRLDYLSAHQNRHALCMCIEKAMGIEVTDRTQYIRTIMDELQRIDSHLLFLSCAAMDLGAITAFIYGFRDREKILDIFEEVTGGRLIQNYNTIGGVQADITPGFAKKVKEYCEYQKSKIKEYNDVFTNNIITQLRMKGVGRITLDDAISYGCTGGTGRASGWACDVRKRHPYAIYDKVEFKEIIYKRGDCYDRFKVRIDEIKESIHIIEQIIDNIPEGDYKVKTKPIIRIPEGQYTAAVEGSRGEFGVFIESHGEKSPYRIKFRPMGLPLIAAMHKILKGTKIADLIAIGATLDYVIPDIDR
ncbi:MAG: NADH-quinone oxidoreductase subunit D [Bacteroidaceae bacterium]|nr:NADH-quinone oxidoreductase subunit D [Bacteroidaceae bacterium]